MHCLCPLLDRPTTVEPTEYSHDNWNVVRCEETGFVFLANPPDYSQLSEEFAWESTYEQDRQVRTRTQPVVQTASALMKRIKRALFPNRNRFFSLACAHAPQRDSLAVLDVGCGWGRLMEDLCTRFAARGRRIIPVGIEVSRQMAADADERFGRLGGRVIWSNAMDGVDQLSPASIDVVILSTFLEHEYQPLKLLRKLRTALAADGAIILKVPNFDSWNRRIRGRRWPGFRYPDHVNYFTPETLALLVDEAGLSIARQNFFDKLPLSDNMYAVIRMPLPAAPLARAA